MKTTIPSFLDTGYPNAPAEQAFFHVIPAPMETTVSYGGGTARGPRAILEASGQLEDFDGRDCPGDLGIHTQPMVNPAAGKKPVEERWLDAIEQAVAKALRCGAVPAVLGGEHTVTQAAARAFQAAGENMGFIQFDAHADLRDSYEGTIYSHACVMRRVHELGFPVVQLGTRAYCREERDYRAANRKTITAYDADVLAAGKLPKNWIPKGFPKKVFITFDLDGLDPSILPATGTPVPGGLGWYDAMTLIDDVAGMREIAGFDVVELAPLRGLHHPDFTAARLVYALMGAAARSRGAAPGS
jgi:agmatinase